MLRFFERLLVFPAPSTRGVDWQPNNLVFEDVYFDADDGTRLHGWFVPHPNPRAVVLYCHGNGEHMPKLAQRLAAYQQRLGIAIFAWDYRSYGRSEGIPHEDNVIADARTAQLWVANRTSIDPAAVVLMGRSLGGAVTVQLAEQHAVRAMILDRTFSTLAAAATHNFPYLPVRLIMRNRFASTEHIQNYHGPLLQMHGTADEVVPAHQGEQLFEAAPSQQKEFIRVPGWNHNAPVPDQCIQAIDEFIEALPPIAKS
ncbi:MAG: alpha/beta fold hydrolase [Planctomycetota bacterium]